MTLTRVRLVLVLLSFPLPPSRIIVVFKKVVCVVEEIRVRKRNPVKLSPTESNKGGI